MTTEVGFVGEIHPAPCDCHRGKFLVVVFVLNPFAGGRQPVGSMMYDTEAQAEASMEDAIMKIATPFLDQHGLKAEEAVSVTVAHGDEAEAKEQSFYRNNDRGLH